MGKTLLFVNHVGNLTDIFLKGNSFPLSYWGKMSRNLSKFVPGG